MQYFNEKSIPSKNIQHIKLLSMKLFRKKLKMFSIITFYVKFTFIFHIYFFICGCLLSDFVAMYLSKV